MDITKVNALIAALESSSLGGLTYEDSGFRLSIYRKGEGRAHASLGESAAEAAAIPAPPAAKPLQQSDSAAQITAPLVGTVYRAREPGGQPLVSVGDSVKKGEPVCLIEAMKMFSEIPAPRDGVIQEILFDDGQLAEYGTVLMTLGEG